MVALVKAGADVNLPYPIEGSTMLPLVMATLRKQPAQVISAFVTAGADINAPVAMAGGKPFIEVARKKWPDRIKELVG